MNGYNFTRVTDDDDTTPLAVAVGLDKETPGLVLVDLIIPKIKGGFRFTAQQFDYFTQAIVTAAKMANSMSMVVQCFSDALEGEEEETIRRVMTKMGQFLGEYAAHVGGEEPDEDPEEEISPLVHKVSETRP